MKTSFSAKEVTTAASPMGDCSCRPDGKGQWLTANDSLQFSIRKNLIPLRKVSDSF